MIAEKIKLVRENFDLSQREMAAKMNISKTAYGRWETGEYIIPLERLVKFCELTNYSIDYILGLSNDTTYDKVNINKKMIGLKIKEIRIKNNLSQAEFAKSINTVQSVISAYESGETLIKTSFMVDICRKYKILASKILK